MKDYKIGRNGFVECIIDVEDTEISSSENDDLMICYAKPRCLKKHAAEEDWIRCNGCSLDFHKHCVGITPDEDMKGKEFFCLNCSPLVE